MNFLDNQFSVFGIDPIFCSHDQKQDLILKQCLEDSFSFYTNKDFKIMF